MTVCAEATDRQLSWNDLQADQFGRTVVMRLAEAEAARGIYFIIPDLDALSRPIGARLYWKHDDADEVLDLGLVENEDVAAEEAEIHLLELLTGHRETTQAVPNAVGVANDNIQQK